MIWYLEMVSVVRLFAQCDVILVVISYYTLYGLVEMDMFMFAALNNYLPFKEVVNTEDKPAVLIISRTTSMKNNWAHEKYKELDEMVSLSNSSPLD